MAQKSWFSAAAKSWAGYVLGAVWALRQAGHRIGGFDLALDSQVPSGAGLSSSAAVECVTTLAVSHLSGVELGPMEIARFAQQAARSLCDGERARTKGL